MLTSAVWLADSVPARVLVSPVFSSLKRLCWLEADNDSRYSYEKQPEMCKWNCGKLGEVLEPLLGPGWDWRAAMAEQFDAVFEGEYSRLMARKVCLGVHGAPCCSCRRAAPAVTLTAPHPCKTTRTQCLSLCCAVTRQTLRFMRVDFCSLAWSTARRLVGTTQPWCGTSCRLWPPQGLTLPTRGGGQEGGVVLVSTCWRACPASRE